MGGGTFPVAQDEAAGAGWWNALGDEDRALWLSRATMPTVACAHLAYLPDQAWPDAAQIAGEWLYRRPAN